MTVDALKCPPPLANIREVWRPVLGYEGLYEISDHGRVWSLTRLALLTPIKSDEYPQVSLFRNGSQKRRPIAALVLETFVGPAPEGYVARPKNGRRNDVRLTNLMWAPRTNGPLSLDSGDKGPVQQRAAAPGSDVRVRVAADPVTKHRVTRVEFRGWAVDLAGATLVLPTQAVPVGGSAADLEVCLNAARSLLAQRGTASRMPVALSAAPDVPGADSDDALIEVLRQARGLAAQSWHWQRFNVYECVSEAWKTTGLQLPHRRVIEALHAVLPAGKGLMEFNLGATRDQVCTLFDSAIAAAPRSDRGAA
ncbi:hypothetical protein CKJ66_27455 [Mycobacterium avium]|uniref:NUMOD4 domain-containing protein n=1 Tax=Mycobacterium avium TaxID=1764 RepID=A0A2A2ZB76_MYCAV|nr:NUMOD4 domain-containing protein [Mycobacterium avium]PBA23653.1 hypothetical protein CKJ66_27455 [Mycobacterium avium]